MKSQTLTFSILLGLVAGCVTAQADFAYERVSFQGRLNNGSGAPASDGLYDMVFKFYDARTNGLLLLTDRHVSGGTPVTVSGGLYTVLLGDGEIVPGTETNLWRVFLNHPEVYVGISVAGEPEMLPRILLTRTPYAVRAEDALTLSGKSAAQFATVGTNGNVVSSGGFSFNATKTGRVTLGPADFRPRHPIEEQWILWGFPHKPTRQYLICTMQSGFASFHADVHLPEGATITRLIAYINDTDPGRTSVLNLARCSLLGEAGPDPVYLATVNSVNNQIKVGAPVSEVVNTTSSHYVLTLQLYWSDIGMTFTGAQVEYTYSELKN